MKSAHLWLVVAIAALLATALVVAVWAWRDLHRRRRRPRREARPRYPVVLAHGVLGFDQIQILRTRHDYFRAVPQRLEREGWEVHRPVVPRTASIARRASGLAEFIRGIPAQRVNVVAHSMGGLDARYAICRLGLATKVASLVTVGTPHQGTPLADLGTELFGEKLGLRRLFTLAGVDVSAFWDLTTARMQAFNLEVQDVHGVAYASVVGKAGRNVHLNPILLPSYLLLHGRAGDNDGLVPVASQRWGEVLAEIDADHLAQIGWSLHFDAAALYESLLSELRGRGF